MNSSLHILFVGNYDPDYNRNKIILLGLENLNDVEVKEYVFESKRKFNKTHFQKLETWADVLFFPSFTHAIVRFICKQTEKPTIFDPLISRYLTKVFDYKQVGKYSIRALKNYYKDKIPMRCVSHLIADTDAHRQYYHQTFGVPLSTISVIPVGVDTDFFSPIVNTNLKKSFIVGFYGGFIPLQGVSVILDAAKLLLEHADIEFRLIGTGFEFDKMKSKATNEHLTNVSFLGWKNYTELPAELNKFDICLGIFGTTPKTELVIPNKIFHYASLAKPIITKNTQAIKEWFVADTDIVLIKSSAIALTNAILKLKKDTILSKNIGENAKKLIDENFTAKKTAAKLVTISKQVLSNEHL